ncbi:MAG: Rossmann-like and DUF2520 domain-containing protein [Anaerovorax sp.]|nr:Rossmann-like and DUF2520 domain-containing protein [Anaerovorax sp.]
MQIGFIGAGKVGFSLGKYFSLYGINVTGYYSRNFESAKSAAAFTNSLAFSNLKALLDVSDTLFLTVPDGEIEILWDDIKKLSVQNKKICHCSGCLSASVFDGIEALGAFGYSVHPLYAISSRMDSYKELQRAVFTLEGSFFYLNEIKAMLESLGNSVQIISGEKKTLYHAAAVCASNQMLALAKLAQDLLIRCGFSDTLAQQALNPLMLGNMEKLCATNLQEALTGPIEREDAATVLHHLDFLREEERMLYLILSNKLLEIARKKHPNRSYEKIEQLLSEKMGGKNNEKYSNHF